MRFGTITPTDIDGLIEYDDKCYVVFESKYQDAEIPYGQKLALVRLVDNLNKPAILIHSTHDVSDCNQDVDVGNSTVAAYYFNHKWYYPSNKYTLRQLTERFINNYKDGN